MDKHDEQFESYLRQFRLRQPGPPPEMASMKRRSSMGWGLAVAAAVVLVAALSIVLVRNSGNAAGPKAIVEAAGNPSLYRVGETIEAGKVIRSNSAVGLLLDLEDGSHVEMHTQSELKLESAADGIRVRLNDGSILVTAAKQGAGHLYVQTRDAMVSVVGTVFLVNAEQSGTTVAVVEGEVHVQQGAELKKLLPGEQVATNPSKQTKPVAEQISWSRSATEYLALLQLPAGTQSNPAPGIPADTSKQPTEINGNSSLASFRMAEARFESGDINAAVQMFRDSLNGDLNPKWIEVWAHINIGKIYDVRGGQRDRAVQEYQKAVNTGDDTYSAQAEAKKYLGAPFLLSLPTQQAIAVPYPSLTPPALLGQPQGTAPPATRPSFKEIPFKVQANYVRVTSDQVRTLITIQFTNRDLAFRDEGGGKRAKAHIEGVIYRIDNRRLPGFSQEVMLEFPANAFAANLDQPTLFQETQILTPGKYKLHITVEDNNSPSIGVQDVALDVPRFPDQSLWGSSMILAYSITDVLPPMLGTDMFALGEKRVKPNVTSAFEPTQPLNVWQEIYGLTVDPASRKSSATIELLISQNNQEIRKLTSNATELLGSRQQLIYTNSVPLGNFAPGQYGVRIKVTDNLAKASFLSVGRFSVASPSAQSDPPRDNADKQIFDRACTSCHSAQVAMGVGSVASRFSSSDRELLASKRAELDQLLVRLNTRHPDVIRLQYEIEVLNLRAIDALRGYGSFVTTHLTKFGGAIPPADVSLLAQYLFEETGRKTGTAIPSDTPLVK